MNSSIWSACSSKTCSVLVAASFTSVVPIIKKIFFNNT
jgi:hypothetical protein